MTGHLRQFCSDENGATIVEHAILACVVALVVVSLIGSGLSPIMAFRSVAYIADSVFSSDEPPPTPMFYPGAPGQ